MNRLLFILSLFLALSIRVFAESDRAALLPSPLEEVGARLSITDESDELYVSSYAVHADTSGLTQLALLRKAARDGKKVHLILDGVGNKIPRRMLQHLADEGVEIRVFNPVPWFNLAELPNLFRPDRWYRRAHDKLFIGRRRDGGAPALVTGSRNLADDYFGLGEAPNRDLGLYTSGGGAERALDYFLSIWNGPNVKRIPPRSSTMGGTDLQASRQLDDALAEFQTTTEKKARATNALERRAKEVKAISFTKGQGDIVRLIDSAQHEVILVSPYVLLTRELRRAIGQALDRNVKVTLYTNGPASGKQTLLNLSMEAEKPGLIKKGVVVHTSKVPGLIHKKAVLVDRTRFYVGSSNLDPRSAYLNTESGFVIEDPELASKLSHGMQVDISARAGQADTLQDAMPPCARWFTRFILSPIRHQL